MPWCAFIDHRGTEDIESTEERTDAGRSRVVKHMLGCRKIGFVLAAMTLLLNIGCRQGHSSTSPASDAVRSRSTITSSEFVRLLLRDNKIEHYSGEEYADLREQLIFYVDKRDTDEIGMFWQVSFYFNHPTHVEYSYCIKFYDNGDLYEDDPFHTPGDYNPATHWKKTWESGYAIAD